MGPAAVAAAAAVCSLDSFSRTEHTKASDSSASEVFAELFSRSTLGMTASKQASRPLQAIGAHISRAPLAEMLWQREREVEIRLQRGMIGKRPRI